MKKSLSILLVLTLVLSLFAMNTLAADVAGTTWYLNAFDAQGEQFPAEAMMLDRTLTFNADGTARMVVSLWGTDMEENGAWTQDGDCITFTGEIFGEITLMLVDDTLVEMDEEVAMVFGTEDKPVEGASVPATIPAQSEADFEGDWEAVGFEMSGYLIPALASGEYMTLYIAAGEALLTEGEDDEAWETIYGISFADGVLTLENLDEEEAPQFTAALCENGTITLYAENQSNIYFAKLD